MSAPHPYAARLAAIPVQRHETEVLGSPTVWWEYGDSDATTTILAVHGFRGEHHGLEPVAAFLPGVRFVMPDLPGFGETPSIPGLTHDIDTYTRWLIAFAAAVAPGAVVLGHSFGSIIAAWDRPNGLKIERVRTPLGVIGVIYESRPNVTADAGSLCLKSGNASILRGGSESFHSSTAILDCMRSGLKLANLPAAAMLWNSICQSLSRAVR